MSWSSFVIEFASAMWTLNSVIQLNSILNHFSTTTFQHVSEYFALSFPFAFLIGIFWCLIFINCWFFLEFLSLLIDNFNFEWFPFLLEHFFTYFLMFFKHIFIETSSTDLTLNKVDIFSRELFRLSRLTTDYSLFLNRFRYVWFNHGIDFIGFIFSLERILNRFTTLVH